MSQPGLDWMIARERHYGRHLGRLVDPIMHSTDQKVPHIDIYQYRPRRERSWWTLVTGGMSSERQRIPPPLPRSVAKRTEILAYASRPRRWMFQELKWIAELPFDSASFLHWGHTVAMSQAVAQRLAPLNRYFVSRAFFESDSFLDLRLGRERVNFLWLVPITQREYKHLRRHGPRSLLDHLAAASVLPLLDRRRESCI